jgi:hypothetical protein
VHVLAFATLPFVFAALAYAGATGRMTRGFALAAAGISVTLECAVLAIELGSWAWSSVLSVCALIVVLPWLAALAFAWYVPLQRRMPAWALAAPLVYGVFFVLGAALGDVTGWIPQ